MTDRDISRCRNHRCCNCAAVWVMLTSRDGSGAGRTSVETAMSSPMSFSRRSRVGLEQESVPDEHPRVRAGRSEEQPFRLSR